MALAAALSNDPPLVLADEPSGELDTANAKIVVDYLRKINQEMSKTILMVTHDPAVSRAADRILRIQDGVIVTDSAPAKEEVGVSHSYADILRRRIDEIDIRLETIDTEFRTGEMNGEEFVRRQTSLKRTREVFLEELHRLGVVH